MKEALDLMQTLRDGILADQALADELAGIADAMQADDDPATTAGLLTLVRNHRIRAMEMQGQLAALRTRYGDLDPAR